MIFRAYFAEAGIPKNGLTVLVTIRNDTDGDTPVNAQAATGVGNGFYVYDYAAADPSKQYSAIFDSQTLTGDERYAVGATDADHLTAAKAAYLDAAISSRSTLAQADILSDATPFAGASLAAIASVLEDVAKLTGNKVTKAGDVITIYEADGTTVWRQYNLADGGRVQV